MRSYHILVLILAALVGYFARPYFPQLGNWTGM